MFGYFWSRNATLGMAALYTRAGGGACAVPRHVRHRVLLGAGGRRRAFMPPGALWRWHQGKRQGYSLPGLLFGRASGCCFVPCVHLPPAVHPFAFLPLVLGIALLIDGIGKLPLAVDAVRTLHTALTPVLWAAVLPLGAGHRAGGRPLRRGQSRDSLFRHRAHAGRRVRPYHRALRTQALSSPPLSALLQQPAKGPFSFIL